MTSVLKLLLDVDVKGADKLQSIGGKLQSTGLGLTKFVTAPLLGVGAAAIAVASDAQKADAKLSAAFKSMGAASFTSIDALNQHAEALANATTFDDDQIKEAQAVLLTFGNVTGDTFDRTTDLAADMSAALGQDLQSSVIQLGKALNDPIKGITALSRVGVSFTEEQKEQVKALVESGDALGAQNLILAEVERQFTGVAEAIGQTDAGKAQESVQQLGEALESVGQILLPFVATAAGFLKDLAVGFQNLDPGVKQFIVTMGGILAVVGPVVFVVGKLVAAAGPLISAFKGVIVVFNLLKVALLTNPFTALAVAVAAIAFLIITNWDKIWAFLKKTWAAITGALGKLGDFFADTWQGVVDATTGTFATIVGIIKGVINGVIDVINGLFGFLNGIQIGIPEVNIGPVHVGGGVLDPFNIPLIPHLAEGGIVDTATLALIGERGPEAVVPLDRLGDMARPNVTIPVQVMGDLHSNTPEELASEIGRVIRLNEALAWD